VRYDSAFGVALGAHYFDRRTLGPSSLISVRARAGGTEKLSGELRLAGPYRLLGVHARYERNPWALFAGLHGETIEELEAEGLGRSRYAFDRGMIGLDSEIVPSKRLTVRLAGDLEMVVFEPGEGRGSDLPLDQVYDPTTIPGFQDGTRLLHGNAELELDTRAERRYGTGFALAANAIGSHGVMDDPSDFLTFRAEGRFFLGLHDRALVFRLRGGMIENLADAPVPFDHLLSPTGTNGLRGLSTGVRRGPSEVLGSLEYQWLIAYNVDAMAFVDYGGAFEEHWEGFAWSRLEPSVGVGLRHIARPYPYWRGIPDAGVQFAWAPDHGFHLLFTIGL